MSLPEKWCIKAEPHTINCLQEHFEKKLKRDIRCGLSSNFHFPEYEKGKCTSSNIESGYIGISYEQFLKYILNKEQIYEVWL